MSGEKGLPTVSHQALGGVVLFSDLSVDDLSDLAATCHWARYRKGQDIVAERDNTTNVYFVCSGRVRATTYSTTGREVTYGDLVTGDLFGELAALDEKPRSIFVVALEESLIASLDSKLFRQLVESQPTVLWRLMGGLVGRIRTLTERVYELNTLGAVNRIHAELLRLGESGVTSEGIATIDPAPTHLEIANRCNTTRESVNREFTNLKKLGVVETEGHALLILDMQALRKMIQG